MFIFQTIEMIRRTAISFSGPTSRHPKAAAAAVFKTITVTQVAVGVAVTAAATALVVFRNQDEMRILVVVVQT